MLPSSTALIDLLETDLRAVLARHSGPGPLIYGLCGAQGSGKSTVADGLAARIAGVSVLSLDDLYLTKAERSALARRVHPMLATRGVPGTHDIALGLNILSALRNGERTALPRFDKAMDDRALRASWGGASADTRVLLLEGWCVGARAQPATALAAPVNALEYSEDPNGIWRRFVNDALATEYAALFARIDRLVLLAAPGFDVVPDWRIEQEADLGRHHAGPAALMSNTQVTRFVAHFERLTRHILLEMPGRADITIKLATDRSPLSIDRRDAPRPIS
ncbi:kinase [Sphingomonas sp. HMP6]|uniref:kinase n=1 Tax=Sphingomonas sp. HMP6 TaxID=1517551 RepID=UPI00159AFADA|nr:hypothetical protein HMP06_1055 [Sphingomonas sp. HMP6]